MSTIHLVELIEHPKFYQLGNCRPWCETRTRVSLGYR